MHGQAKSISLWAALAPTQEKAKSRESRAETQERANSPPPAPPASASYKHEGNSEVPQPEGARFQKWKPVCEILRS